MTTSDRHLTRDLAALQRLPEDEQPPDVLDPTCATTGVTGKGISRPDDEDSQPPDAESDADSDAEPEADRQA